MFYLKYEFSERVQKLVFWPVLAFFGHIQSKDYALPKIIGQKIQSVYEKKSYTTTLFNMSVEEWAVFFSLPTAELFCSVSAWWYLVQALFNFEGPIDFHKRFLVYIRASGQKKVYMHLWTYTWDSSPIQYRNLKSYFSVQHCSKAFQKKLSFVLSHLFFLPKIILKLFYTAQSQAQKVIINLR